MSVYLEVEEGVKGTHRSGFSGFSFSVLVPFLPNFDLRLDFINTLESTV